MRQIVKNVYTFSELSDEAKEKALQDYQSSGDSYAWSSEAMESLQVFAKALDVTIADYEIDWLNSVPTKGIVTTNDEHALDSEDAQQVIKNGSECKWTGYCMDADCAAGFEEAWNEGERNARELFEAGADSWYKSAVSDAEHQFSLEGYADFAEANELEFYEDGSLI